MPLDKSCNGKQTISLLFQSSQSPPLHGILKHHTTSESSDEPTTPVLNSTTSMLNSACHLLGRENSLLSEGISEEDDMKDGEFQCFYL